MRFFTALFLVATVGVAVVHTSAQTVLGKHPADVITPGFFNQNNNASNMVAGINQAPIPVTNVNWNLNPYKGNGSTNGSPSHVTFDSTSSFTFDSD